MKNTPFGIFAYQPPTSPWLSVIYRDAHILLLDKPSGLLSVPGKPEAHDDCLEERARKFYRGAMTVHRLDRDTSGIMVMGMTRKAHANLSMQFEKRQVKKTYIARVWGSVEDDKGHIDLPLGVDWENRPKQIIDRENGKSAQTDWEVIAREESATRVRLAPATGRSHQLRVHMLSLGHPILGDVFYAEGAALEAAPRLHLHAESLTFTHPDSGAPCTFIAPCPF
ncbi:MAG: RluA family pseudouridine synthase [Parvibaculaceae bacterium]